MGMKTVKYDVGSGFLSCSDELTDVTIFTRANTLSGLGSEGGLYYTVVNIVNKSDASETEYLVNTNTGITVRFTVSKNGKYHSVDDLPAVVEYDGEDGSLSSESWYKDGFLWRAGDAPASVEYWPSGHGCIPVAMRETWYGEEGLMLSSDDHPAMRQYDSNGTLVKELFTGKEGGPRVLNHI